jgi:spermidine synthase
MRSNFSLKTYDGIRQLPKFISQCDETALIGLLFFLSGIPALVYQICWQRMLILQTGVGVYSVAMIVAAYMAGLGIGSHLGGLLSEHISKKNALSWFAFLELGIGLFALFSRQLYVDVLYLFQVSFHPTFWWNGFVQFSALVIPTSLMGMSLPFLVRSRVYSANTACRTVGFLYGINTLGAAFGSLLTTWVFIRHLGIGGAILAGVSLNLLVAAAALTLSTRSDPSEKEGEIQEHFASRAQYGLDPHGRGSLVLWTTLYALSGFCAIGLEILWFRIIDVAVKSTSFTYGTVLATFLASLAAGSLFASPYAIRIRRPLMVFLYCQSSLVVIAGLAILLLTSLPPEAWGYRRIVQFWSTPHPIPIHTATWSLFAALYILLPVLLCALPSFLMGVSFTVLQRAVHDDPRTSGKKVGILQAANIAGCAAGSLVVGLVGLRYLGTAGSLRTLIVLSLAFPFIGLWKYGLNRIFFLAASLTVFLALAIPTQDPFWRRLHGEPPGRPMFAEDFTGLAALIPDDLGSLRLSVNGSRQGRIPFGGLHTVMGALPAIVHHYPRKVLIIGLGSGGTPWAASCRPETESTEVFELVAGEHLLLQSLVNDYRYPGLSSLLKDPRLRLTIDDGRNCLKISDRCYDMIEADPILPLVAYSGNLYSAEFFELCRSRLSPGGIMCQWNATPRVQETFCSVFPYVLLFKDFMIGSTEPVAIDLDTWKGRLCLPPVRGYLGEQAVAEISNHLGTCRPAGQQAGLYGLNHDLIPRDEFGMPSSLNDSLLKVLLLWANGAL